MRPSWHQLFIKISLQIAERSTCLKIRVGAVLTRDNRIISIGYNGTPAGQDHCETHFRKFFDEQYKDDWMGLTPKHLTWEDFLQSDVFKEIHHEFVKTNEIHAEANAILYAAKSGISTNNSVLYTVYSPCTHCAKSLLQAGIKEVYFKEFYERDDGALDFLNRNGIKCQQVLV